MKNELIRKGLVFGMVLLFVGTSVVSATIFTNQLKAKDNNRTVKIAEDTYYNLIGGVNVTFDFPQKKPGIIFEWWRAKDRNFTYPITNGTVCVNYTFRFQTYAIGVYFIPRIVGVITSFYYPEPIKRGEGMAFDLVPFGQSTPGYVKYIFVKCDNPMDTPPPDENSTKTKFLTWNTPGAFAFPPIYHENSDVKKIFHADGAMIPFWANFTQG